jgi:hypothetical protein
MANNLYKYYRHTQLVLESFCKKLVLQQIFAASSSISPPGARQPVNPGFPMICCDARLTAA